MKKQKRTVLIVEDNDLNRDMLNDLLEEEYDTLQAENGAVALERLKENGSSVSAILLDLCMPVMDGLEFLSVVKKDATLKNIPVIMMTGAGDSNSEIQCLQSGAIDFIAKPYDPEIVKVRLKNVIDLHESTTMLSAMEYDELTGLYTKEAFFQHAKEFLERNKETKFDIVVADVVGFKYLREKYGEARQNELIAHIGKKVRDFHWTQSFAGSISPDRFACFTEHDDNIINMDIIETTRETILNGSPISDANLKLAYYEGVDHNASVSTLCDRAFTSLKEIKDRYGVNVTKFDEVAQKRLEEKRRIVENMETALAERQFEVYYQPKHDLKKNDGIGGAEALVRWIHPTLGFMNPGVFIPTFEQNGFIKELDLYMLTEICKDFKEWLEKGVPVVPVSVNLSRFDFSDPELEEKIVKIVESYGIPKKYIHFEVTESTLSDKNELLVSTLKLLHKDGFIIELDDFGSGYSTLASLGRFEFDIIKLDMSLLKNCTSTAQMNILKFAYEIASVLHLKTVQEGVETEEQLKLVRSLGCDYVQGYYFSKPLKRADYLEYLNAHTEETVGGGTVMGQESNPSKKKVVHKKAPWNIHKTRLLVRILSIVFAVFLFGFGFVNYDVHNRRRIAKANATELVDNSVYIANQWDEFIESRTKQIKILAKVFAGSLTSPSMSEEDIARLKDGVAGDASFDFFEFCDVDGKNHTVVGTIVDATERPYYINGMQGITSFSLTFNSKATHETLFSIYTPIVYEDTVVGVLIGVAQAVGQIQKLLNITYSNQTADVFLCEPNGYVVATTVENERLNPIDEVRYDEFFQNPEALLKIGQVKTQGGMQTFGNLQDGSTVGCVKRTESGWFIIQVYPESAFKAYVKQANELVFTLSIIVILAFTCIIVTMMVTLIREHKEELQEQIREEHELYEKAESSKRNASILYALSGDVLDVNIVDFDKDTSKALKQNGKLVPENDQVVRPYASAWKGFIEKFVVPEDREKVTKKVKGEAVKKAIEENGEEFFTFRLETPTGKHTAYCRFVKLPNNVDGYLMAISMIDKQVEEQERQKTALKNALDSAEHANKAKTDFLNNMSHDIRTPMNAIVGFSALAISHIDNERQVKEYLDKIQVSSKHLLSLVNDILDMSRIESGKTVLEERETDLSDVMHDLRTIVQADITSKQLEFYIDAVDVRHENVLCDRLRLNQVLLNLLSNSMKFTKPGGTVSLRICELPCETVGYANYRFIVKDTGIGMSEEFVKKIFLPFERERTSTVSGIQGTGLGMSICKNIVDMMNGKISVESKLGVGTAFTVDLRFKVLGEHTDAINLDCLKGSRALVVDDDYNTCESVTGMLANIGMRSDWTTSGKEAVIRTQLAVDHEDKYSVYIIDWLMNDMNGVEVVRRIRKIIGDDTPIIILSAYDWTDIEDEAKEAGVTAFISKPIFMSDLKQVLSKKCTGDTENGEDDLTEDSLFEGKKVLLVEDNVLNQEIATEILTELGFKVDFANDGTVAVEKAEKSKENEYDIILMDIQMPIMNGYEATEKIRALGGEYATKPIIAMTANAFDEHKKQAFEVGMDDHIAKPIMIPTLIETLKRNLATKKKENK